MIGHLPDYTREDTLWIPDEKTTSPEFFLLPKRARVLDFLQV